MSPPTTTHRIREDAHAVRGRPAYWPQSRFGSEDIIVVESNQDVLLCEEPFYLLSDILRELGERPINASGEIGIDIGITCDADIVAPVASGANSKVIDRAYRDGMIASGRTGVGRVIAILSEQLIHTTRLLGTVSLAKLNSRHAAQLSRLLPRRVPRPGNGTRVD